MRRPDVSAVIVAWNSGQGLAKCVESLEDSARRANVVVQFIVVDNGSTDDAVDALRLTEGDIRLRNPVNAGFGVAAAQGLARAGAEWALEVNPDLVVAPEFFEALLRSMQSADPEVAVLVPEIRFEQARDLVNARGITVDEVGIPAEIDVGKHVTDESGPEAMGGSSGCCLLRLEAVRQVGGPEPVFFAYLEDVDLAIRLQSAGYRALFVPEAIAWHEGSSSTGEGSPVKSFLVARNRRVLFRLHGPHTISARLWRLLIDLGHALVASVTGSRAAPWLGRVDALRLRRYTGFLRRSRRRYDPFVSVPRLTPRAGLRATLRRKRAAGRVMHR
jgi:GT2 family glycosyltransferase